MPIYPLPHPIRRIRPFPIEPPLPFPGPVPPGIVPEPFPDSQENEYIRNGIVYNGITGLPVFNIETGEYFF